MAKKVVCKSGNEYELKLGAVLLHRMSKGMTALLPMSLKSRLAQERENLENLSVTDIQKLATEEELLYIEQAEAKMDIEHLRLCLKTVNGDTNVAEFMEEELPATDMRELVEVIDSHIKEYSDGLNKKGESSPSSSGRKPEKESKPLPVSQSS